MKTATFQHKVDLIIEKLFLWSIPDSLKPNFFTYLRIILVPVIIILIENGFIISGFSLFVFAALTDAIDGALARTRNQITDLGKILDPVADKLLILSALVYVGFKYLVVKIFIVVILFEIVGIIIQSLFLKFLQRPIPANVFGKIKMIMQCLSIIIFFIGYAFSSSLIFKLSEYLLIAALLFAVISAIEQVRQAALRLIRRHEKIKSFLKI